MSNVAVGEEEIKAAEKLRANGEYAIALVLTQEMLSRVQDDSTKIRLLLDILYCSTRLGDDHVTDNAIRDLGKLPEPEISRVFADLILAMSYTDLGRIKEALELIEANLKTEFMERDDFRIWKYKYLVCKGRALTWLAHCDEALNTLGEAQEMYPGGELETDILIAQTNCLFALDRYDEAYAAASLVLKRDDGEMAALALQYMAEIRVWQKRVPEALDLYIELQKRLPCRLVQEERFQKGMNYCIALVEKLRPQGRPHLKTI